MMTCHKRDLQWRGVNVDSIRQAKERSYPWTWRGVNIRGWQKTGKNYRLFFLRLIAQFFYTNLHELFCQFISWTNWANSGKFIDNCWIFCQVMVDMEKFYDNLRIINLYQRLKTLYASGTMPVAMACFTSQLGRKISRGKLLYSHSFILK